ncbi:hypothetical protein K503DRAFT_356702 [Rhizopogon vinicolor AM-OR11-026]|uniref:Uncharacterized protein n=1 Tax=Rhizopogon vinicolor AM-OR11-026 TaxID=1314800 RepID=A0A1B7MSM5_9AGAM|nr:hypothetical protein K503DRAFT_356702 [Rhizopogon vinicolor AM-OR11-026]
MGLSRPVQPEGEAIVQESKNTLSVITSAEDATPGTQLTFPNAQVQSPTTMQGSIVCSDTPADPTPSVASPTAIIPKPQPKRSLKAPPLSEHLKNRDLEWFKTHQQSASPAVDPPVHPGALESMNDAAGPPVAGKLRPSRMPGRIPVRPPLSEPIVSADPANAIDQSSTLPSADVPAPTDVKEPKEDVPLVVTDVVMSDPQPENEHEDLEAPPSRVPESTVQGVTVPEATPPEVPAPEVTVPEVTVPEVTTPEVLAPEVTTPSPKPNTNSPAPTQPPSTTSDNVGVESHDEGDRGDGGDSLLSRVDDTFPPVPCPRFGGHMAVMVFRQGLQSHRGTLKINFELDDTRYSQIAQWAKRKSSQTNLEQSVCISFACYHLPSLVPNPEDGELPPFETLTMDTPCSWPTTGDLSLQTKRGGKDFVIPLAPPIFVTPDNCVDVSAFVRNGENDFSVVQQSDMSEYMFMLHAHHPTPAQLSYLAEYRREREEWARAIRALYKPEPMESLWKR